MGLEPEKSTAGASLAREYLSLSQQFFIIRKPHCALP
jgi:hypothetical protein